MKAKEVVKETARLAAVYGTSLTVGCLIGRIVPGGVNTLQKGCVLIAGVGVAHKASKYVGDATVEYVDEMWTACEQIAESLTSEKKKEEAK